MDNIAHTLVGLALAESGLKRASRLATPTLLIGANLPDLDALTYLVGSRTDALAFRRGWTHGILAMLVLPPLLMVGAWGWGRLTQRNRGGAQVEPLALLGVAATAVWSHPLLDLLNSYGVRLLMPFSGHWYHADALFILDPWLWLVLVGGIVMVRQREKRRDPGAGGEHYVCRPARTALVLVTAYALGMALSARWGHHAVEEQTGVAVPTMVAPIFGNPFRRVVIRDLHERYEVGTLSLGWRPRYATESSVPVGRDEPGVAVASATRSGAQFLSWARFPRFESEREGGAIRVRISDVRYAGMRGGSWASVTIRLPAEREGGTADLVQPGTK